MPQHQEWVAEHWQGVWHLKDHAPRELFWEEYFTTRKPTGRVCKKCKLRSETANL